MTLSFHKGGRYGFGFSNVVLLRHPDGSKVRELSINLGCFCIEIGFGFAD
jgi:hypothetical protein